MNPLDKYKELQATENPDLFGRWYGTKEQPYLFPSVTTILKETIHQPGLINWFKDNTRKAIEKRLEETGAIGEDLHKLFDSTVNGHGVTVLPKFKKHSNSFTEWVHQNKVVPTKTEFLVVSEKYGYAGRVDFFGEVAGKMMVIDWKTGTMFGDTWGDQVAAYQMAISEMLGLPLTEIGFGILQVNRETGEARPFMYSHLDWMQDSFLLALERFKRVPRFTKLKKIGWPYLLQKGMVRA